MSFRTATIRRAPLPRQLVSLRGLRAIEELPPQGAVDALPWPLRRIFPTPIFPRSGPVYLPTGPQSVTTSAPPGSYQLTSRNIFVDGNGNLNAQCQKIDGTWQQSPPLYYLDCQGDISNQNGVLTCAHASGSSQPFPTIPPFLPGVQPSSQINPQTGQPYTPIPPNGPLPPGAGYQQVEQPGSPYPYVYIGNGTGTPPPVTPYASSYPYPGYPTYPSTAAVNVPLPGGGVANPAVPLVPSLPGIGSSIGSFFSQYGLYIALGLGGLVALKALRGRR